MSGISSVPPRDELTSPGFLGRRVSARHPKWRLAQGTARGSEKCGLPSTRVDPRHGATPPQNKIRYLKSATGRFSKRATSLPCLMSTSDANSFFGSPVSRSPERGEIALSAIICTYNRYGFLAEGLDFSIKTEIRGGVFRGY